MISGVLFVAFAPFLLVKPFYSVVIFISKFMNNKKEADKNYDNAIIII